MEYVLIIILVGLSGTAFWWRSRYFNVPISNDMGVFLYYAQFYQPKWRKYSEFYLSPYNNGFHRLCRQLYRWRLAEGRYIAFIGCLVSLATAWLIYLIARCCFDPGAAFGAACLYLYCTSLPSLTHRWDWIEIYLNFLLSLAILLFILAPLFPDCQLLLLFLAGLGVGLAIFFKLTAVPFSLGLLVFLTIFTWTGVYPWSGICLFIGGTLLPLGLQAAEVVHQEGKEYFYWWLKAWKNLFRWKKIDCVAPSAQSNVSAPAIFRSHALTFFFECLLPLWLATGYLFSLASGQNSLVPLLLIWLGSESLVTLAIHRVGWLHHFYTLLPPICLMSGKMAEDFAKYLYLGDFPLPPAGLLVATILGVIWLTTCKIRENQCYWPSRVIQNEYENLMQLITGFIQRYSRRGDYLFQWGPHFHLQVRAQRLSPAHLGLTFCFQPNLELQLPDWRLYLLDAFLKRPPQMLYINPGRAQEFPFELLNRLAGLRYTPLRQLQVEGEPVVYQRQLSPPTEIWSQWRQDNDLPVGVRSVTRLVYFLIKYFRAKAVQGCISENDLAILQMLASSHPALAQCYQRVQQLPDLPLNISVFPARNGEYTGQITQAERTITLHSLYNPDREAEVWLSRLLRNPDTDLVILGAGLGHHVNATLRRQKPGRTVYLIERSQRLYKTCAALNAWEQVLQAQRLIPLIGKQIPQICLSLQAAGVMNNCWLEHRPSIELDPEYYRQLKARQTIFREERTRIHAVQSR